MSSSSAHPSYARSEVIRPSSKHDNDGDHPLDQVLLALVKSRVPMKRVDDHTYELENPDGVPTAFDFPPIVGWRLIQVLISDFGLDPAELIKQGRPNRSLN